jgi:hypothetical protein
MRSVLRVSTAVAPPRSEWSVEKCARFAARRDYHLIKSLCNDRATLIVARELGLVPGAPKVDSTTTQETQGDQGGSDTSAATSRRRARRPRKKREARKQEDQDPLDEEQEEERAAAAAEAPGAAAPTTGSSAKAADAAAGEGTIAAQPAGPVATPASAAPAAGKVGTADMDMGGREKRGAESAGFATPEKEKGGDEQQQGAVGRGGSGGGSGRGRKKRLAFENKQGDKKPEEETVPDDIKYAETRRRVAAMSKEEREGRQHSAMMMTAAIEIVGFSQYLNEEKLFCDLFFRDGFETCIHTVGDFQYVGIPEEGIKRMLAGPQRDPRVAGMLGSHDCIRALDHRGPRAEPEGSCHGGDGTMGAQQAEAGGGGISNFINTILRRP